MGKWTCDIHRLLTYGARACHWLHARNAQLESALLRHFMDQDPQLASAPLLEGHNAKTLLQGWQALQSAQPLQQARNKEKKQLADLLLQSDVMPEHLQG